MKQLRVLTGRHAGADLILQASTYRVGADPASDLALTDWNTAPLVLTIPPDDEPMSPATLRIGSDGPEEPLALLRPRRFGDIVLCLGPADDAWPSDFELLQGLLQASAPAAPAVAANDALAASDESTAATDAAPRAAAAEARARARQRWALVAATVGVASMAGAFALVVGEAQQAAAPRPVSRVVQAQRVLDDLGLTTVSVRSAGESVVVEGLLESPADVSRLRSALAGFPAGVVQARFAAASDIGSSIAEALGAPGLRVRYLSRGEFLVEGEAVHAAQLQAASQRIVGDLQPLVRAIRLAVVDVPPTPRTPPGAMLSTAGMKYVQTRDGIKHISLFSLPALALTADGAGPHPPANAQSPRSDP